MSLGIEVLREWAGRATLTETDVLEERGVVLDEWRTRAQGFGARVNEQIEDLILSGTAYEGHQPIGDRDSILAATPEVLESFYADWYRPGRMAVAAVGDFDHEEIVQMIVDAFTDLPDDDDPPGRMAPSYEPPEQPAVSSYVDEEAVTAGITALWPVANPTMTTVGDYEATLATSIGVQILADRLSDDASSGKGALLGATVVDLGWTRALGIVGVDAEMRAGRGDEGLVQVLEEVERVRRHGITDEEFERAIAAYTNYSKQVYEQRESTQDIEFVDQIVGHHLGGGDLMSPSQRFEVESAIVARLTAADIDDALGLVIDRQPAVLALGPDDADAVIPGEDRILEVLEGLPTAQIDPRGDTGTEKTVLMQRPEPAPIVSSSIDPRFEYTTLEFGNGATVYLWESDIAPQAVLAQIEGFGGLSLIDVPDLPEAFLMTEIVGRSGVAGFDVPALRRILTGRIVAVQPWISETRQGLEASAALADVETMFQLIHLTITEPRFDATAVDAVLDEMRTLNTSRDDLPDLLFEEAMNRSYYGDDPRYFVVPDADQLSDFDLGAARRAFASRFGNAADFAFALVGDFDTAEMTRLAASYIGTLPGGGDASGYVDHQPLPPRDVQVTTVEAGSGEQGQVGMFFTNEFEPSFQDRLVARLLELILTARLRERVREELSATYSIQAGIDLQRDPDEFAEAFVMSSGDPAGLDQISDEVLAELSSLQREVPSDVEFATALEQMRDELELVDNGTLASGLVAAHLYPDQPMSELVDAYLVLDELAREQVMRLAGAVFDLDQRIEVRQVPRR